jgi:hypothetical protein
MFIFVLKNMKPVFHLYTFLCFSVPIFLTHLFVGLRMLSDLRVQLILLLIPFLLAEFFYWKYDMSKLTKTCLKFMLEDNAEVNPEEKLEEKI